MMQNAIAKSVILATILDESMTLVSIKYIDLIDESTYIHSSM